MGYYPSHDGWRRTLLFFDTRSQEQQILAIIPEFQMPYDTSFTKGGIGVVFRLTKSSFEEIFCPSQYTFEQRNEHALSVS